MMTSLEERGIDIPADHIAVVMAAFENWIRTTREGKEHVVNLFGFDWAAGDPALAYEFRDEYGRVLDRIKSDQIYFLQAAVAKGEFVPLSQITTVPVEKHGCDACGILSHCTRVIKDSRGKDMRVCNHCLQFNDESDNRSLSGGHKECESCTATLCEYNPAKERRKLA